MDNRYNYLHDLVEKYIIVVCRPTLTMTADNLTKLLDNKQLTMLRHCILRYLV